MVLANNFLRIKQEVSYTDIPFFLSMDHEVGYTLKHDYSKHTYYYFWHMAKSVLFPLVFNCL